MQRRWQISRRALLRGGTAAIALPVLDVMAPDIEQARARGEAAPKRWVMWQFPCGYRSSTWNVTGKSGSKDWEVSPALTPLEDLGVKEDVTVVQGTAARYADGNGGGHTCGISGLLSGFKCQQRLPENRRTIDQEIASQIAKGAKIPSLQLGTAVLHEDPNDEKGYASNIKDHLSWKDNATPMPKQVDPAEVFLRLFGDSVELPETEGQLPSTVRDQLRASVLDHVLDEAARLQMKLGQADVQKVDQYLTAVRDVEKSIQVAPRNNESGMCDAQGRVASFRRPDDIEDHVRQMNDLMVLAMQCDVSRVIVFQYETTVTSIRHPFLDVNVPYHLGASHHGSKPEALAAYYKVNRWLVSQFGSLVAKLKETEDAEGSSLLDNSSLLMTSELGDGDLHNHVNLPCLLAGKAGGAFKPGKLISAANHQFMHVLIATAQAVGADINEFGWDYARSATEKVKMQGPLEGLL